MNADKFHKVAAIHTGVTATVAILGCALVAMLWSYEPDTGFDTLHTLLFPSVRVVVTLAVIANTVCVAFDRITLRVLRRLKYQRPNGS